MIIHSLHIENLLHFEELTIPDLTATNFSCITTTDQAALIEALHFTFFGKPMNSNLNQKEMLYKDSHYSACTLNFTHEDEHFQLMRTFDADGDTDSLLLDKDGNLLVESHEIEQQLQKRFFGSNGMFAKQAFFTALPEPANTQQVLNAFNVLEFHRAHQSLTPQTVTDEQVKQTQQHLDELALEEDWLPELIDTRETLQDHKANLQRCHDQVKKIKQNYAEEHQQFHSYNRHFQVFNGFANALLPITSVIWFVWALFVFAPNFLQTLMPVQLYQTLAHNVPTLLFPIGCVILVFYSFSLIYSWWLDSKQLHPMSRQLKTNIVQLKNSYQMSLEQLPPLSKRVVNWLSQDHTPFIDLPKTTNQLFNAFCNESKHYEFDPPHVQKLMVSIQNTLKAHKSNTNQYLSKTNDAITKEMQHSEKAARIRQQLQTQKHHVQHQQDQFATQQQAQRLLLDTSRQQLQTVQNSVDTLITLFTRKAYRSISIDDQFALKVHRTQDDKLVSFSSLPLLIRQQICLGVQLSMRLTQPNGFVVIANIFDRQQQTSLVKTVKRFGNQQQILFIGQHFDEQNDEDVVTRAC